MTRMQMLIVILSLAGLVFAAVMAFLEGGQK